MIITTIVIKIKQRYDTPEKYSAFTWVFAFLSDFFAEESCQSIIQPSTLILNLRDQWPIHKCSIFKKKNSFLNVKLLMKAIPMQKKKASHLSEWKQSFKICDSCRY